MSPGFQDSPPRESAGWARSWRHGDLRVPGGGAQAAGAALGELWSRVSAPGEAKILVRASVLRPRCTPAEEEGTSRSLSRAQGRPPRGDRGTVQRGERLGLARPRARTRCSGPAPGGGTGDGDWVPPCLGGWSAQPGARSLEPQPHRGGLERRSRCVVGSCTCQALTTPLGSLTEWGRGSRS